MAQTIEANRKKAHYKIIEKHLRNYRSYLAGIKNMHKQLDYNMPPVTASWEMKEEKIGVFIPSSTVEKYAIERIESNWALKLHEDIVIYELIVNSIDAAVAELSEEEREFVELRYFNGCSAVETAEVMGYSERQIYLIRQSCREQLLISLKNIVMLKI